MSSELNTGDGVNSAADRGWLAGLLLRRGDTLLPRLAYFYRKMAALPRPWRRQLRRKLALTVSGAALLLALSGPVLPPALADANAPEATITVVNGEVAIVNNNKCSLMEAIINARATTNNQMRADCANGNINGPDTVSLPTGGNFVLTTPHNEQFGPTGLPVITDDMIIEGHGSVIRRAAPYETPEFRIMAVDPDVNLTLRDTTISNGNTQYYNGGGILNHGNLTIERSTVRDNLVYDMGGGILNTGNLVVTDSRIINNGGYNGGGGLTNAEGATATISGSLIADNESFYYTAGISNYGVMVITNSTVSGNDSWENGAGGITNYETGMMALNNVTVSGNVVSYDGTGGVLNFGDLTLNRTIISGNFFDYVGDNYDTIYQSEITNVGTITVNNRNVFGYGGEDDTGGFNPGATDVVPAVGLSAILSPLADNGGSTATHALPQGSPALDLAPNAQCAAAPVNGVDQRGEPRNQNGAGGVTNNECDAGSFERQAGGGGGPAFLVSPSAGSTVGGVAFAPADILKYDPATGWSLYFDGSDVGITKNVSAFEVLDNGDILMSFQANQAIPGLGTVKPQNVVRFTPTAIGPATAGWFEYLADTGLPGLPFLTTSGEKIDALGEVNAAQLAISTAGTAAVKDFDGASLKAQDEDALAYHYGGLGWSAFFDGAAVPGLKAEDVNAIWVDQNTGDLYVSILGSFNLSGVSGNGRDIVKLTKNGNAYTPSLWWDGSAAGFPVNVDGLEILP